jgi:long-chain fatty acid transport protein
MTSKLRLFLVNPLICLTATSFLQTAHANIIQYFWGDAYKNPAESNQIDCAEFHFGSIGIQTKSKFTGTTNLGKGAAWSSETDVLPYFFGAARATKDLALGVNVSRPLHSNVNYPNDSIVREEATQATLYNVDINPHVSYKVLDNLFVGAGVNINRTYDMQNNFSVNLTNIVNQVTGWDYGWNIGAFYAYDHSNFFSLSYFSQIKLHLKGTSSGESFFSDHHKVKGLIAPSTTVFKYIHVFNPQWAAYARIIYCHWRPFKLVQLTNTPFGTLNFQSKHRSTWFLEGGARYQLHEKWALMGGWGWDQGSSTLDTRGIAYYNDNANAVVAGGEYRLNKQSVVQFFYAFAFFNTEHRNPFGFSSIGKTRARAHGIDIKFIYKF